MRGGEAIAVTLIFVGIPWVLGWIFRTYLNHVQFMKVLQLRAENNARMLDRFGSDAAFLDYLKSDAQQKMFDLQAALTRVIETEGSDLHLKVPSRPLIRTNGDLEPIPGSEKNVTRH